jgi:type I restriction enzyme S subunit
LPFPVPPPPEQDRIVARIDELFAEITEGETALQRARSGLDTWRQTLLKAAITGELTSDWREANKAAGTADEVLAKIRLEKDSGDPVTRRGRRTSTQAAPDLNSLHELPSCWRWARMSDVTRSDTRNGISIGDYPVLDFLA